MHALEDQPEGTGHLVVHQRGGLAWLKEHVTALRSWASTIAGAELRLLHHLCSYQQGGAAGESTGPGLACPHLQYHPLGLELRLLPRSGALVVRGHPWGRGRRGSDHATSALGSWCSLSASTLWRMYLRSAGGWFAAPRVGGVRPPRRR